MGFLCWSSCIFAVANTWRGGQVKHIESELMTAIAFLPRALLTAGKTGLVKMWVRPLAIRARMGGKGKVKGVSGVGFGFGGGGAEDGT